MAKRWKVYFKTNHSAEELFTCSYPRMIVTKQETISKHEVVRNGEPVIKTEKVTLTGRDLEYIDIGQLKAAQKVCEINAMGSIARYVLEGDDRELIDKVSKTIKFTCEFG